VIRDPRTAPTRTDLPFLRHRSLRRAAPASAVAAPAAVSDFLAGRTPPHHPHPAATVSPPGVQEPAAAPAPPPARVSSSLDLDEPGPSAPAAPAPTRSLAPPGARPARSYPVARVQAGARTILTPKSPTVTLTRTQTGIGTLTFDAACSEAVGDLQLAGVYQLRSGLSSTVQSAGGNRFAPPGSRWPVLVAGRDRYARITVDLRQCQDLERMAVIAYSESRAHLSWGGTLITTTFGGARIELPLEELTGDVGVLMSLYNVRGEFVLRAEMQAVTGSIREASRTHGYDRITWLDDRTPVD
jgi:hypothetical protein